MEKNKLPKRKNRAFEKYVPSDTLECQSFIDIKCRNCARDLFVHTMDDKSRICELRERLLAFGSDKDIIYGEDGIPNCNKWIEHLWEKDGDGKFLIPDLPEGEEDFSGDLFGML